VNSPAVTHTRVAAYADRVMMVRDGLVSADLGEVGDQVAAAKAAR
jgi:hypothetical protein